jgi:hypothetical protein
MGLESEPAGDLHVEDGERDRKSATTREYLVEKAVARVVVLLLIAAEAFELEERVVQGLDGGARGPGVLDEGASTLDDSGDALEGTLDLDLRSCFGRDHQGAFGETELALRSARERSETIRDFTPHGH